MKTSKIKIFQFAAICTAFLYSSPIFAGWQYTEWGMTPEQVITASDGKVIAGSGRPGQRVDGMDIKALGTYVAGSRTFNAVFYFENNKLVSVRLNVKESPSCSKLFYDMRGVYGNPEPTPFGGLTELKTWRDSRNNNMVGLLIIGNDCELIYQPLISDNAKGL